jgi:SAM-dependent methyltransferase
MASLNFGQPLANWYARAREMARRERRLYALVRIVKYGPDRGIRDDRVRKGLLVKARREGWRMLYLGSGGQRQAGMINLDITPVTGPDVVGDGYHLPFADGTFEAIFCDYVIEHVADPERFLAAAGASLKPHGLFYLEVPFIQPFHGSPLDFTRWTLNGFCCAAQRGGFTVVDSGVHFGPAYMLWWMLAEWLAALLSLGSRRLSAVLCYCFKWALAPIQLLDLLMLRMPRAADLAAGFYVVLSTPPPRHQAIAMNNASGFMKPQFIFKAASGTPYRSA